jgi:hypothetical protein
MAVRDWHRRQLVLFVLASLTVWVVSFFVFREAREWVRYHHAHYSVSGQDNMIDVDAFLASRRVGQWDPQMIPRDEVREYVQKYVQAHIDRAQAQSRLTPGEQIVLVLSFVVMLLAPVMAFGVSWRWLGSSPASARLPR